MLRPTLILLLITAPLAAQKTIAAFGEAGKPGQRSEASLFIAEVENGRFVGPVGAAYVTYGAPEWRAEYAQQIDALEGVVRLGKNNWTTFDSTLPMTIGGTRIPAGVFYLALERDADGNFGLVFIDPAAAKKAGAWPFTPEVAPKAHRVPLEHSTTDDVVETLTIEFARKEGEPTSGDLVVAWGNHRVSAPYEAQVATSAPADAAAPKRGDGR